ncbi:hypothetical protein EAI_06966, partial [Harpegnathos saltator]
CKFKIDTGSDVSIVNSRYVRACEMFSPVKNSCLIYPTGEAVPIHFQKNMKVQVVIGKIYNNLSMFIADIKDDCLLGNDFLSLTDLESCFHSVLGIS